MIKSILFFCIHTLSITVWRIHSVLSESVIHVPFLSNNLSQIFFSATMLSCLDLKLEVDYYSMIINTRDCKQIYEAWTPTWSTFNFGSEQNKSKKECIIDAVTYITVII